MTFVIVDAPPLELTLEIAHEAVLLELGQRIKRAEVPQLDYVR